MVWNSFDMAIIYLIFACPIIYFTVKRNGQRSRK
jgi:hypothetical protein